MDKQGGRGAATLAALLMTVGMGPVAAGAGAPAATGGDLPGPSAAERAAAFGTGDKAGKAGKTWRPDPTLRRGADRHWFVTDRLPEVAPADPAPAARRVRGANNHEDDLALIAAHGAPLRTDEAGDVVAAAVPAVRVGPVVAGVGHLVNAGDVDVFALGRCRGLLEVRARGARPSPNLDLRITLLDRDGDPVARAAPRTRKTRLGGVRGLGARLEVEVPRGRYHLEVAGIGAGGRSPAYDDYASLGAYRWRATGCA
ncbi:hypothetical protein ACFP3Q_09685 [Nocardioides sp. GCM10027113]|uniref:hypothetical protein n=1 Tax=unclassified Nocardioides TaxID=2615069 RepID=UPI0036213EA5